MNKFKLLTVSLFCLFLSSKLIAGSSLIPGGGFSLISQSSANTGYVSLSMLTYTTSSELQTNLLLDSTGTLSNMWVRVPYNIIPGTSTIYMRKDNANGNMNITINALTTGDFSDDVNTDVVESSDTFDYRIQTGSNTGVLYIQNMSCIYNTNENTVSRISRVRNSGITYSSGTFYWVYTSTEANSQVYLPKNGTCRYMWVKINSNTCNQATTFISRVNGANGNMSITVPASTAGSFRDRTNTDSVSASNLFALQYSGASTSGSMTVYALAYDYVTTSGDSITAYPNENLAITGNQRYMPILRPADQNFESTVTVRAGLPFSITGSYVYISSNPTTATSSMTLKVSLATTSLVVAMSSKTAGWFMDTSKTIALKSTDTINYMMVRGSAASLRIQTIVTLYNYVTSIPSRVRRAFNID